MSLSEALKKTYKGRMIVDEVSGDDTRLSRDMRHDILIQTEGKYWSSPGLGYVSKIEDAHLYKVSEYFSYRYGEDRNADIISILGPVVPPTGKKCAIQSVLGSNLITNLKAAPTNKTIRTAVHAVILKPLPDEVVTYDAIKDWIENNIDANDLTGIKPWPDSTDNAPAVSVRVQINQDVDGHARFYGHQRGSRMYEMTIDEVLEAANLAVLEGTSWDNFTADLRDRLAQRAEASPPEMELVYEHEDDGDEAINYEGHDIQNHGDIEMNVDYARLVTQVRMALQRHRPDLLEQF